MVEQDGGHRDSAPFLCGSLTPCADRLGIPFAPQCQRPLEHRDGCGLGLPVAWLRFDRLLGHELGPGEQRIPQLLGFVVVATVPVDVMPVRHKLGRRPDAEGVVVSGETGTSERDAVPVLLDDARQRGFRPRTLAGDYRSD